MSDEPLNRRQFVNHSLKTGFLAGLTDLAFLRQLPSVSATEAKLVPAVVSVGSEMEPLVRLIEDTPREKLLESVADCIHHGTSYGQILGAVLLAGVRGIKPRPVGFKFHAVLVINSAHLASLAASDRDRWLPLFWALDNFKVSQAQNRRESNWMMPPVNEAQLPPASQARQRFVEAMDRWDEEGADRAVTALVRSAGAGEIIELFWRYGARDFRDIGHKAIYVANSWRALQTIGWRHAEPVMRSLAFALLEHEDGNPAERNDPKDLPWRENLPRVSQIRDNWQEGKLTPAAAIEMLQVIRKGSPADACAQVVELIRRGTAPATVWDGLFLSAGELLMRQPGIIGVHCVTSVNALYYGYTASSNEKTRRLLLLQAAAFLPMFRKFMAGRGQLREDLCIDTLEKIAPTARGPEAVEEVFADINKDRLTAARKTLALLADQKVNPDAVMAAARCLIFSKGNNAHDYKFSSAALEDYYHTTPAWRNRYLAMSMFNLRGSGDHDNDLIRRAKAALA